MATYLLTWNPEKWQWHTLTKTIEELNRNGYLIDSWSAGVTKKIQSGDRVFLIKLGKQEPRGIMASGWAISSFYKDLHWDKEKRKKREIAIYNDIRFDTILDPEEGIFPRAWLNKGIYAKMRWEPPASGTTIPNNIAFKLEKDWAKFLNRSPIRPNAGKIGAGFGTPESNKKVEIAAVSFVRKYFESKSWRVHSVENSKCGYDLVCIKSSFEKHIEVKGIQGEDISFSITAGEVHQAEKDRQFILCVVTSATSKNPRLFKYSKKDFYQKLILIPMMFRASLCEQ